MEVTFIVGYRDRDHLRLKNSLESLKKQTCMSFHMVLIDYGSRLGFSSQIRDLLLEYSFCRYCYSDTRGWMWNRSAALNTGAKLADTTFLFFSDIDIIYPPWFVERLLGYQDEGSFLSALCYRCPPDFNDWDRIEEGFRDQGWSEMGGRGLLSCSSGALIAVGGMDEQIGVWGSEDLDLTERLQRHGMRDISLPDFYCFHQWHPKVIYHLPESVQFSNLTRFYSGRSEARTVVNLNHRWGRLIQSEDRPIFDFLDPQTGKLKEGISGKCIEAFNAASMTSVLSEMDSQKNSIWIVPHYVSASKNNGVVIRLLRRMGWKLDRRVGYAEDFAEGLVLSVPGFFRDYFLGGIHADRDSSFFLTPYGNPEIKGSHADR